MKIKTDKSQQIFQKVLFIIILLSFISLEVGIQNKKSFDTNLKRPKFSTIPTIEIQYPLDNTEIALNSKIIFTVSAIGDTLDSVQYKWDDKNRVTLSGSSPFEFNVVDLTESTHTLNIYANTSSGDSSSFSKSFIIDNSAPIILISSSLETKSGNDFDFDVDDANTIRNVSYYWDSSSPTLLTSPYQILVPVLSEGMHFLNITSYDNAMNKNSKKLNVIIDETSPEINLNSATTIQNGDLIDLIISDENTLDKIQYNWNGATNISLSSPYDIIGSNLGEGTNMLNVFVSDLAGNSAFEQYIFTLDNAPKINLISPSNNSEIQSSVSITLAISDLQSIDTVWYNWDSGENSTLLGIYNIDTNSLTEDLHYLYVFANDSSNKINSKQYEFIIDNTPPSVSLLSPTENDEISHSIEIELSITEENTLMQTYFKWESLSSIYPLNFPYSIQIDNLNEGEQELIINAEDLAGNILIVHYLFTIDNTSPQISLIYPEQGRGIDDGDIIELNITDLNTIDNVLYNWNGNSNTSLTSPFEIPYSNGDGGENYILNLYAYDLAGNLAFKMFNFSIDEIAPSIHLIAPLLPIIASTGRSLMFSITDPLLEKVWYTWDEELTLNFLTLEYTILLPMGEGHHNLHLYANDTLGNLASETFDVIVDNVPPIIELLNPGLNEALALGEFVELNISDANTLEELYYSWNSGVNISFGFPYQITSNGLNGTQFLQIYAIDQAGNIGQENFSIYIDITPPAISLVNAVPMGVYQASYIIEVSIEEQFLESASYGWDNNSAILWTDNYNTLIPFSEGNHTLHINAIDSAGNSQNASFIFITDNTPPTISFQTENSATILRKGAQIILTVLDLYNISLVFYNWDNTENTTLLSPYSITIPDKVGTHILSVTAIDQAGNAINVELEFKTKIGAWIWIVPIVLILGGAGAVVFLSMKKQKTDMADNQKLTDWFKDHGYKLNK